MVQSRVTRRPNIVTASGSEPIGDDGALLIAALAATLVEHQRVARYRNGQGKTERAGLNWRTIARLEQLRGQT
jgi:hypothetical protein